MANQLDRSHQEPSSGDKMRETYPLKSGNPSLSTSTTSSGPTQQDCFSAEIVLRSNVSNKGQSHTPAAQSKSSQPRSANTRPYYGQLQDYVLYCTWCKGSSYMSCPYCDPELTFSCEYCHGGGYYPCLACTNKRYPIHELLSRDGR
jgi:hypothetical protein